MKTPLDLDSVKNTLLYLKRGEGVGKLWAYWYDNKDERHSSLNLFRSKYYRRPKLASLSGISFEENIRLEKYYGRYIY